MALGTFFSEVPQFEVWFPVMFVTHFCLVLALKLRWEKEYWKRQDIGVAKVILAAMVSAAASFLVFVKMQPSREKLRGRPGGAGASTADEVVLVAMKEHSRSSMLNMHFYFHLLVLAENVALGAVPIMMGKYGNTYFYLMAAIVVLWVVSIVCKYIFYKLWGHPWKDINGPKSYLLAVCGCLCFFGKRRGEHEAMDVDMGDITLKRGAEINEVN